MADTFSPCRCSSRIIMSSPRVTTVLLPPAKGRSIGGDGVDPPHGKCPWGEAGTTKLGKIRRPQSGRIQRPLTRFVRCRVLQLFRCVRVISRCRVLRGCQGTNKQSGSNQYCMLPHESPVPSFPERNVSELVQL